MSLDLSSRAQFLRALAPKAAALAKDGFHSRDSAGYTFKGPQDFLTQTDLAVEAYIRAQIKAAFPDDGILGEEGGGAVTPQMWIIDPIDGTANFARGVPHFCVCICFCCDGAPVLGAIYQPLTDEFWFAQAGQGAQKNGHPIRVSTTAKPDLACVEMGWSRRHDIAAYLQAQSHILESGANIRRGGSGALALAWVAEGRSDGYLESMMQCWDCLAGMLLVQEAGGAVRPFGRPAGGQLSDLAALDAPHPVRACTPTLVTMLDQALCPSAAAT